MKTFRGLVFLAGLAAAAPTSHPSDTFILQYALTLEHLEDTFYHKALGMFNGGDFARAGLSSNFYSNIQRVAADEASHVAALTAALKNDAVPACTYNFAFKTVNDFLNTAAVLEGVGVSAYLGAAGDIQSKAYLAVAGSILTTESRHSAYIRGGKPMTERPFAAPYDVGLDYRQVFSLAAGFIVSCPKDLGLTAFPALTVSPAASQAGGYVCFSTKADMSKSSGQLYAGFTVPGTTPAFVPVSAGKNGQYCAQIPTGCAGQTYVALTSSQSFTDDCTIAGPGIVEVVS